MTTRVVVVGLGSNQGDRLGHLQMAVDALSGAGGLRVASVSAVYETKAVGPPQPDYLNAALRLESDHRLDELLELTRAIEARAGRVRRERWGPRTLDIDILWAEEALDVPQLTVPHPRLMERAFALAPLLDVLPGAPEVLGQRLSELGGRPKAAQGGLRAPK